MSWAVKIISGLTTKTVIIFKWLFHIHKKDAIKLFLVELKICFFHNACFYVYLIASGMSWKSQIFEVAISKGSNTQCSEPCHQGFVGFCFVLFLCSGYAHIRLTLSWCQTTTTTCLFERRRKRKTHTLYKRLFLHPVCLCAFCCFALKRNIDFELKKM